MSIGNRLYGVFVLTLSTFWLSSPGSVSAQDADALINARCSACHAQEPDGGHNRLSEVRKTPEAWDMTLVRMMNVHGLKLTPEERRALVKHLSDSRGLAPSESAGWRYVLEKTPGVTDAGPTEELGQMCGRCHTFARVALQRRSKDDWLKLMHFHLGQYPTAEYQALGRDRDWWGIATTTVVDALAESLPLETEAWRAWQGTEAPDLTGVWRFVGHQPGVGSYDGRASFSATGDDSYEVEIVTLSGDNAVPLSRGAAVVYSGHEVRIGVSDENDMRRRVTLTTGGDPDRMTGRWFLRDDDVIGGTVYAVRASAGPEVMGISPGQIKAGTSETVTISGVGLSGDVDLGPGLSASIVERTDRRIVAEVTAAGDAATGARNVAVGGNSLAGGLVVYDKVAALQVEPAQTFARLGGNGGPIAPVPAQFQAIGFMAGADGAAGTEDDVRIGPMEVTWSVSNFDEVAEMMKDADFAGRMTAGGLFEPAGAGPNEARPMTTNNAGNLLVTATMSDAGATLEGSAQLFVTVQRFVDPPIR